MVVGTAGTGGSTTTGLGGFGGTTGTGGTGGACTPTYTCTPAGGQYCNTIGNGCKGQKLECGACPGDATCSGGATAPGICIGGPSCTPLHLRVGRRAKYCGKIGDGCGRELDCGTCAARPDLQRRPVRARQLHAADLQHRRAAASIAA